METIKEFLVSDIYLDIIKELGVDNFNQDVQSVEVEELKNAVLRANDRSIWKRYYRLV